MELVTFQSFHAYKHLINNGYLICNEKHINQLKYSLAYNWVVEQMDKRLGEKPFRTTYPLWAWMKFKNYTCPPKHRRAEAKANDVVKITFTKNLDELFITDYIAYSFVLNNLYLPKDRKDYEWFEKELQKRRITIEDLKAYARKDKYDSHRMDTEFLDILSIIRKSWDGCITTTGEILQACFWKLDRRDVVMTEFCTDENYDYNTVNYMRYNKKRPDWIKKYINDLN